MIVIQLFEFAFDKLEFLGDLVKWRTINLSMPQGGYNVLKILMVSLAIEEFERNFPLVKVQPRMNNHGTMI